MKKYVLLAFLFLFSLGLTSQTLRTKKQYGNSQRRHHDKNIVTDIHGNLQYEDADGVKASLSKDIFGDMIYKDNRNNEVNYSAKVWNDVFSDLKNERDILSWLVEAFHNTKDMKEKYKKNIHDDLEYENNQGLKASLSKDIFDTWVYKDSKGNEIKYSKEYWPEIKYDFQNKDIQAFFWMMDQCHDLKNYKEEYKIDIFGYQQYKNSLNQSASLSKNVFDEMVYKDNKGTEKKFTQKEWNRLVKRHHSDKKAFIYLIKHYLFKNS